MEATVELPSITDDVQDEKMSSFNHSELQSRLAFLLMSAYRQQYSILTELDFDFASGKTVPIYASCPNAGPIGSLTKSLCRKYP